MDQASFARSEPLGFGSTAETRRKIAAFLFDTVGAEDAEWQRLMPSSAD